MLSWIDELPPWAKAVAWACVAAMAYVLVVLIANLAKAQDEDPSWGWRVYQKEVCDFWHGGCRMVLVRRKVYHHREEYRREYPREYRREYERHDRDYGDWDRRNPRDEHGVECKWNDYVRAVGDRHANPEKALADAEQRWREVVVHLYGEVFMDLNDARDYRKRCSIAVTGEGATGTVANALERVGVDSSGKRCMIVATPCKPGLERAQEDRR